MDGYTNAALWVIEDVTEARRAEQAMRETSERLELVQEAARPACSMSTCAPDVASGARKSMVSEGIAEREFDDWRATWRDRGVACGLRCGHGTHGGGVAGRCHQLP